MTPPPPPPISDEGPPERFNRLRPFLAAPTQMPEAEPTSARHYAAPEPVTPGLRPFVLTSGRVDGVDPEISLETQVTARPDAPLRTPVANLAPELRAIVMLCAEPASVAEISARTRLHLGVTKILVGDLRAAGYLDVHVLDAARPADPHTILRVIRGLREIS